MNAAVPTGDFLDVIMDAIRAVLDVGGDEGELGLFTGSPVLSKDTVVADLVALAPTYTGYARQVVALEAIRHNGNGDRITPLDDIVFQPTAGGGTLPNTITGYYLTYFDGAAQKLALAEYLPAPVVFVDEFSALTVQMDILTQNLAIYGGQQ